MRKRKWIKSDYLSPDKYLTDEEIRQLRCNVENAAKSAAKSGSIRGRINRMLVEVMLETGLRAEEICNLELRDLPTHHGKDVILVRCGKGGDLRVVEVKQSLKDLLQDYIKNCRKSAKPGSPLFASEAGCRAMKKRFGKNGKICYRKEQSSRLTYHDLYMRIKRIGKRAGLNHLHPHMFRHTFASHLYKVGRDLRFVQIELGHSRPETTARYARVFAEDARQQIERLYQPIKPP